MEQRLAQHARTAKPTGVVQKVTFFGATDNVNFGWFTYDSTDGHPKKCYQILNHAGLRLKGTSRNSDFQDKVQGACRIALWADARVAEQPECT